MEEAQELSDHIAIMDQGRVVANGTHAELVDIVGELDRIDLTLNAEAEPVLSAWTGVPGVRQVSAEEREVALLVDDSNVVLPQLFELSAAAGMRITSVEIQEPNLEAVFLHLTGRALRD
jgi:ABC-2 type transport system ATP-binding protein